MKTRRHTPEQVIRKSADGDKLADHLFDPVNSSDDVYGEECA